MRAATTLNHAAKLLLLMGVSAALSTPSFGQGNSDAPGKGHAKAAYVGKRVKDDAAKGPDGTLRVIVSYHDKPDAFDEDHVRRVKGELRHRLDLIDGHSMIIPAGRLNGLLNNPRVKSVVLDEPTQLSLVDTSVTAQSAIDTKPAHSHPSAPTYNQSGLAQLHRSGP